MKRKNEIGKETMLCGDVLVKTDKGWIKAKDLKVGDKLDNIEGKIINII